MQHHATLPPLRGRIQEAAPLAPVTWFRVGGPAEWLVRPADLDDLLLLLRDLPDAIPLTVIGAASNLIVRDGGVRGVVLRLAGRAFAEIATDGEGTIGGAVAMNAGAYGAEVKDVLDWAEVATPAGLLRLSAAELIMAYRKAVLPPRGVVVRARFRAAPGEAAAIAARMNEIRAAREATQPVRARTGGSTFKNPPGAKAWQLVDAAGCRGLARGGAQVSELHTNFLLNTGGATAADIEGLGEEVRARVKAASGIELEWEIKRVGEELNGLPVQTSAPSGAPVIGEQR
jgi:UDP-N-acetylmuramate dehydrogenase